MMIAKGLMQRGEISFVFEMKSTFLYIIWYFYFEHRLFNCMINYNNNDTKIVNNEKKYGAPITYCLLIRTFIPKVQCSELCNW